MAGWLEVRRKGTQRAQRTRRCAELVWWYWVIRQRLLLVYSLLYLAKQLTNCQSLACTTTRLLSMGAYVSVVARSAKVLDRINYNLDWIWVGVVACVVARCCVRVVCVIQLSRSGQASSWLCTQDDFSGLTCISCR